MTENISKAGYLITGLGVGSLIGVLFAPKSGDETREYLTHNAKEARQYAEKRARDVKERAEELVEQSIDGLAAKGNEIATAVNVGREAYYREYELAKKRQ